jgi:hypothetical protein
MKNLPPSSGGNVKEQVREFCTCCSVMRNLLGLVLAILDEIGNLPNLDLTQSADISERNILFGAMHNFRERFKATVDLCRGFLFEFFSFIPMTFST